VGIRDEVAWPPSKEASSDVGIRDEVAWPPSKEASSDVVGRDAVAWPPSKEASSDVVGRDEVAWHSSKEASSDVGIRDEVAWPKAFDEQRPRSVEGRTRTSFPLMELQSPILRGDPSAGQPLAKSSGRDLLSASLVSELLRSNGDEDMLAYIGRAYNVLAIRLLSCLCNADHSLGHARQGDE
jgi:hypothetical protein